VLRGSQPRSLPVSKPPTSAHTSNVAGGGHRQKRGRFISCYVLPSSGHGVP
jgi:hypothetical protein